MRFKKFSSKLYIQYHGRFKKKTVEWYFGNVCDLNCSYCLNSYTRREYYRNMTFEETQKTINFINTLKGLYEVVVIGGEPSKFKYCLYGLEHLKDCRIALLTNGMDEDFIKKAIQFATQKKPYSICVAMHYEYYIVDKEKYKQRLLRLMDICKENKFVQLEFLILLDKEKTEQYKELIEWITRTAVNEPNSRFVYSVSYVRRGNDVNDAIQNYAITLRFSEDVKEKLQKNLQIERMSFMKENPNYHKQCCCFKNYLNIRLDGRIKHADCGSPVYTKKSIFDNDFNLEDEIHCIECCEKHTENNGICNVVLGRYKR